MFMKSSDAWRNEAVSTPSSVIGTSEKDWTSVSGGNFEIHSRREAQGPRKVFEGNSCQATYPRSFVIRGHRDIIVTVETDQLDER